MRERVRARERKREGELATETEQDEWRVEKWNRGKKEHNGKKEDRGTWSQVNLTPSTQNLLLNFLLSLSIVTHAKQKTGQTSCKVMHTAAAHEQTETPELLNAIPGVTHPRVLRATSPAPIYGISLFTHLPAAPCF